MRIIKNECKKILNIRILIILCIFTVLYYQLFMQVKFYPSGGQCTDSPYDIPFAAQLVKEIGPTLSLSDWSVLDQKEQELKKGLSVFWICPAWDFAGNMYWTNISFGTYMVIMMVLVLMFTLGSVTLAYWIGRISVNYIAGIVISIPICVALSFVRQHHFTFLVESLFYMGLYVFAWYFGTIDFLDVITILINPINLWRTCGSWFMESDWRIAFAGNEFWCLGCCAIITILVLLAGKRRYAKLEIK